MELSNKHDWDLCKCNLPQEFLETQASVSDRSGGAIHKIKDETCECINPGAFLKGKDNGAK